MTLSPKESGSFIAKNAKHIKIHDEGINKLSDEVMKQLKAGVIKMDIITKHECYPQGLSQQRIADWVFAIDALNYCFWTPGPGKWEISWKNKNYTGYFALCAAIARAMENGIDFTDPKAYSKLSEEDIKEIFKSRTNKQIPLLEKRVECLQEVGQVLIEKYNGSFVNCIKEANGSAVTLLNLITTNFKCFDDVSIFQGKTVSLHKRAQIVIADIWTMFNGEGLGEFKDIDQITMFADYRVPQALVHFGAMSYDEELLCALKKNEILENGNEYEVEIRGCSIEVIERVMDAVKQRMKEEGVDYLCNSILIDNYLWKYRRDYAKQLEHIPFHKVISIYY